MATLLVSQASCTKSATAPAVPPLSPPLAPHVSKALPLPPLFPAASRTPLSNGVGWDKTAKHQEYVRMSWGEG